MKPPPHTDSPRSDDSQGNAARRASSRQRARSDPEHRAARAAGVLAQRSMQDHDESNSANFYMRGLAAWVAWVSAHPKAVLALVAVSVVAATIYSAGHLRMNSDNTKLVRQDAPFRQAYHDFLDHFPQFRDTALIVLTGESIDVVSDAQKLLADALGKRKDLISYLYAPGADPFFEDRAFLYLDDQGLDDAIERLARAQPALTALSEDPSLRGLFAELELGVKDLKAGGELPTSFVRMSRQVSEIGEGMLAGRPRPLRWADELLGDDTVVYRVVIVQGQQSYGEAISSERLITEIRETARQLGVSPENGVTLRLTGMLPLAYEELVTLREGLGVAGALSIALLIVILRVGLRSLRIIVATLLALVVSLAWTTAYAMLTVGEFNVISAAFAILLLGLGVDFGIHLGLRYEEETCSGVPVREALVRATAATGGAISLCALTSAIGFASFIPTEYRGLAALGVIAGGGMLFSLINSFTVFPAVLTLMGPPTDRLLQDRRPAGTVQRAITRHAGAVVAASLVLAIVTTWVSVTRLTFDFSALAMKDHDSEGMQVLRELYEQSIVTDYSITALAPDAKSAEELATRLEALEVVAEVRPPSYFLPDNQEEKLLALEDAAFFLEGVLYPEPSVAPPSDEERLAAVESLRDAIRTLPDEGADEELHETAHRLGVVLDRILAAPNSDAMSRQLEALLVDGLAERLDWLRRAIRVESVEFADLPADLRARVIASDGRHSVVALPSEDMSDVVELGRFVDAVTREAPDATGRPTVEAGIGGVVVRSFRLAIELAFVTILLILLFTLRSLASALMVLMPISLAAVITVAFGVVFDVSFNMANVVAIPLVLGLGVDSGIHVFMRYRHEGALDDMLTSSTPRAVFLSAMTTLAAFASLSLSPHPGISSLGILLSISVLSLLYCTLVVLPAMIVVRDRWPAQARTETVWAQHPTRHG